MLSLRCPLSPLAVSAVFRHASAMLQCERQKFTTRQSPIGGKDDYDSEDSWISDGLPSSSRTRRRGEERGHGGEWRQKWNASGVDVGVDSAKSEIKVETS